MLLPDSKQKEYEQNAHTPFVFRQVKPALWKAPLAALFYVLHTLHDDEPLANDVCLRAHKGKHRIIATKGNNTILSEVKNIISSQAMHH